MRFYRGYKEGECKEQLKFEYDKLLSLIKTTSLESNDKENSKITLNDFCEHFFAQKGLEMTFIFVVTRAAVKSMIIGIALMTFGMEMVKIKNFKLSMNFLKRFLPEVMRC